VVNQARRILLLVAMGFLAEMAVMTPARGQSNAAKFAPPEVTGATDIAYPPNTTTIGMVSLMLNLDSGGKVQDVHVIADTPPLTAAAQASVQKWTFKAAKANGTSIGAYLPVSVVFNPYNPSGTSLGNGALTPPPGLTGNGVDYLAPQIRLASCAFYPANTLVNGTVVLSVGVDTSGHVSSVKVVHGVQPLNDAAVAAVKQWGFQPAERGGQIVPGKIGIAFVFQRNLD
jgi:TonB family protein